MGPFFQCTSRLFDLFNRYSNAATKAKAASAAEAYTIDRRGAAASNGAASASNACNTRATRTPNAGADTVATNATGAGTSTSTGTGAGM